MARFEEIILLLSSTSILFPMTTYIKLAIWAIAKGLLLQMRSQKENPQGHEGWLGPRIRHASCQELRSFSSCSHHRPGRSSLPPDRMRLPGTEIFPVQQYPTAADRELATVSIYSTMRVEEFDSIYLHCHKSLIHQNLLCEKVRSDGGLVTCAELLVDLRPSRFVRRRERPKVGPLSEYQHIDSSN